MVARLPALVEALTYCDPRGKRSIGHIARVVREAGLLPTSKRGRGASEVTSRDGVALLMGLNGSESPAGAPEAVKRLSTLRPSIRNRARPDAPVVFASIVQSDFSDALRLLIDKAPSIQAWCKEKYTEKHGDEDLDGAPLEPFVPYEGPTALRITFRHQAGDTGVSSGGAAILATCEDQPTEPVFAGEYVLDPDKLLLGVYGDPWENFFRWDRRVEATIGLATLLHVHHALGPDSAKWAEVKRGVEARMARESALASISSGGV
jgi:hypothetical protein